MTSSRSWALAVLVLALATGAASSAGCGDDQAVVGGACVPGYEQSGQACVPVTSDDGSGDSANADGANDDGASDDGSRDDGDDSPFYPDGRPRDGFGGDGTGDDGTLVDGCTPPYDTPAHCGDCFTACVAPNDQCKPSDGGFSCQPLCSPPFTNCGGLCVDTTSDAANCGACGVKCQSLICLNSVCIGSASGGIVYAGHDYSSTPQGTAQARVLSNAVFIPQNNPLSVMSFEHYAQKKSVTAVDAILNGVAAQVGRTLQVTATSTDTDIPNKLKVASYQVLLVHDQTSAAGGALATLGASWASTLTTFTLNGGIVVVLDGGTGIGEMPQFTTGTGLLAVSGHSSLAVGTPLTVLAPADAVGVGVVSPYGAGKNSVTAKTEPNGGNVVYVVGLPVDGGSAIPIVVHKVL